jgi:hypothetical protein
MGLQLPHYGTDFKDGANLKGLAASFFLFFACLAPAVAFGGLLGKATQGQVEWSFRQSSSHEHMRDIAWDKEKAGVARGSSM